MRYLTIAALLLAAGCSGIADSGDLRPPQTAAEWQEFSQHGVRTDRVWSKLVTANMDLCGSRCTAQLGIGPSAGIGAFAWSDQAGAQHIALTFPALRMLSSDDELAYMLAHEWSHLILRHYTHNAPRSNSKEMEADCVGSLLAARAGYRLGAGVEPLRRMTYNTVAAWMGQIPDALPRAQYVQRVVAAAQGKPITRATIKQVCGIGP